MKSKGMVAAVLALLGLGLAPVARAEGTVEIGGRTGLTVVTSLISSIPDFGDSTNTLLLGGTFSYTTRNARHEFAGGFSVVANFGADLDFQTYTPNVQYRINSNLLGPEENWLLYLGGVVGAAFIVTDGFSETAATYGPKAGVEYYFNSNVALQLEDVVLWQSGTYSNTITNSLTIGLKVLF